MDTATPPWQFDSKRKTMTHKSGVVLTFYSAIEFEIERIPPGITTRELRELVREAERAYAIAVRAAAKPAPAPLPPPAPIADDSPRANRLSLKKRTTNPT